jgi:hypothetical protein
MFPDFPWFGEHMMFKQRVISEQSVQRFLQRIGMQSKPGVAPCTVRQKRRHTYFNFHP